MNVNTATPSASESVQAWLTKLQPEHEAMVMALRTLVRAAAPDAHEIVYHDALGYGPSSSRSDRIFYVAVFRMHINLGFFSGGGVQDPDGLLIASGKRMRHIKLWSLQECAHLALPRLLEQAWAVGLQCAAQRHGPSTEINVRPAQC